jgi:hypothetical protein
MKKFISFLFLFSVFVANAEMCACGSYETGTYTYVVKDKSGGCCEGEGTDIASLFTWSSGSGRTWILKDIKVLKVSEAMGVCCPSS